MTSIQRRSVTRDQLEALASRAEDHFFDRKRKQIQVSKLAKTVSAFANADGGEILVGAQDDGTLDGFGDFEDLNGIIQGLDDIYPMSVDLIAEGLEVENECFLLLTVQKSAGIVYSSDKIAYVRRGAQGLPYNSDEKLRLLKRIKGITSFEDESLSYEVDEIANSLVSIEFLMEQVPTAEPEAWLRKQRLISATGRPSVAGTLLFHDEPQVHLPKAAVKLYRYATTAVEGSRDALAFLPITIEGCAYAMIEQAVSRTVAEVERIEVATASGVGTVKYPREAIHEIVTNAILHRDYGIVDDVHIRIFDDRVEIQSPGRLPAHVTTKNILEERFARNGKIVRLINKFPNPPNQDVGEGLNTAFEAMRNLDLRDPEIREDENSVTVFVRHERLASPEGRIVTHLRKEQEDLVLAGDSGVAVINNSQAREITGIHSPIEMRKVFERAQELGQLARVPGTIKGGAKYCLPEYADQGSW